MLAEGACGHSLDIFFSCLSFLFPFSLCLGDGSKYYQKEHVTRNKSQPKAIIQFYFQYVFIHSYGILCPGQDFFLKKWFPIVCSGHMSSRGKDPLYLGHSICKTEPIHFLSLPYHSVIRKWYPFTTG